MAATVLDGPVQTPADVLLALGEAFTKGDLQGYEARFEGPGNRDLVIEVVIRYRGQEGAESLER